MSWAARVVAAARFRGRRRGAAAEWDALRRAARLGVHDVRRGEIGWNRPPPFPSFGAMLARAYPEKVIDGEFCPDAATWSPGLDDG